MVTTMRVMVKVMAEQNMDQVVGDWALSSSCLAISTTDPIVMVEKIRKAAHCVNRGDLDSDIFGEEGE